MGAAKPCGMDTQPLRWPTSSSTKPTSWPCALVTVTSDPSATPDSAASIGLSSTMGSSWRPSLVPGTRFITSHENSDWHPAYLQALLDADEG